MNNICSTCGEELETLTTKTHQCLACYYEYKCKKQQKRIDELEKVLEFYAQIACPLPKVLDDNDEIEEMNDMDNAPYYRGGKRARQALKKENNNEN